MMGKLRLCGTIGLAALGALGCVDDGKVLGERSHSEESGGSGNRAGSSSTGGERAQGGSSPTGGATGTSGETATGGSEASTGGSDANGGDGGASAGDGGASGSSSGGSSNGGDAGAGTGAGGGSGGASGTPCVDRTCSESEACVAYRTIGGALTFPEDGGACPSNAHRENDYCLANFGYQCVAQPRCTGGTVDCTCGSCPQTFTACRAPYTADWLDTDAKLVCEQLAP